MRKILYYFINLLVNNVISDDVFSNHCNVPNGFIWCDTSNKCLRPIDEPCLPITKDCAICLINNYNNNNNEYECEKGCTMDTLRNMENAGFLGTDENGCSIDRETIWCPSLDRCIEPTREICRPYGEYSSSCNNVVCPMVCEYGYDKDTNGCTICRCSNVIPTYNGCNIKKQKCNSIYTCPVIHEVTQCSYGGLEGFTTYRLSLQINDHLNIKNIYAIFGNSEDVINGNSLFVPPAYQGDNIFNSNIGGIQSELIDINYLALYDSWLTIGITDGNIDNKLSSIGVDFNSWTETSPLNVTNGAIFLLNPNEVVPYTNEYIIGQLTIPTGSIEKVYINVQGQTFSEIEGDDTWTEENIEFDLSLNNINRGGH